MKKKENNTVDIIVCVVIFVCVFSLGFWACKIHTAELFSNPVKEESIWVKQEPIGEAYMDVEECERYYPSYIMGETICFGATTVKKWVKFTEVQDEHCITSPYIVNIETMEKQTLCYVKINGQWIDKDKTFLYKDIDIYEQKRKEIEGIK